MSNLTVENALRRLQSEVGTLLAQHKLRQGIEDYAKYAADPVGFIREVLRGNIWEAQSSIAEQVRDNRQVVVRSANGIGKDWLGARLALWWVYARRGMVLITGPTERQVRQVVMGEVARAFGLARDLPGELYELALRLDRSEQTGILAFTSSDVSKLTGFHAPRLMVLITEAQGVDPRTWEGMLACATGEDARILAVGNPLNPDGRFFEVCRSDSWQSLRVTAFEHPNLKQSRDVIPGAVTQRFVDSIRMEYGEESGIYRARVLAEFPDESEEALVQRSWLNAAAERWKSGELEAKTVGEAHVGALDPARFGADHTAFAVRQGPILRELVTWSQADTMTTCGLLAVELERLRLNGLRGEPEWQVAGGVRIPVWRRGPRSISLVVDEIGVGSGVVDRLKELRYDVEGFNGGKLPSTGSEQQFLNLRAQAYWHLRRLLEEGQIALPEDTKLFDELAGTQWRVNSAGKIQLESKDDTRARLGRSPDRADAVAMAFHKLYHGSGKAWRTFKVGI